LFIKDINEYNYDELIAKNNLKDSMPHFYAANNLAE
jgi:hypothetical protein